MLLMTKQHMLRGDKEYGVDKEQSGHLCRVSFKPISLLLMNLFFCF